MVPLVWGNMPDFWKITRIFFLLCVVLLPFAEWKIFVLPLNGKTLGVDWTGYRSGSAFDLAFFVFCILLLPCVWDFIKEKRFLNPYLVFWIPAFLLAPVLYVYLRPHLPYLTPSQVNVIDTRSFIIHFSVTIGVTIFLASLGIEKIIRGSYFFYSAMIVLFAILCGVALSENSYFYFHYPFTTPFTISFPFPNQNVAAPFITICLLGIIGTGTVYRNGIAIILAAPIAVLAASLTGSRSNMVILACTIGAYGIAYVFHFARRYERREVSLIAIVVGVVLSVGIVALNYDWQPVRRSLSLFKVLVRDPIGVVKGIRGSPRWELWWKSLFNEKMEGKSKPEKYKMFIVAVKNGIVSKSGSIRDLQVGEGYYVRLSVRRTSNGWSSNAIEVFLDKNHDQLLGKTTLAARYGALENLFLFVSDTGRERGLVTVSASLDNYKLRGRNGNEVRFTFSDDEGLAWYEEWYDKKYGDSRGVIRSGQNRLVIVAYEQGVRAYVNKQGIFDGSESSYVMEYELLVDKLEPVVPFSGPARFYVGFHDGNSADLGKQWEKVRNALLVAHERMMSTHEEGLMAQRRWLSLRESIVRQRISGKTKEIVKETGMRNDGGSGQDTVKIEKLWEPDIGEEDVKQAKHYRFGAEIHHPDSISPDIGEEDVRQAKHYRFGAEIHHADSISVEPDESWSAKVHLAKRGSTHSVYLDWYYYVGKIPFGLFLLLLVLLLQAMIVFLWKRRNSPYAWFYFGTWLQIIVIGAAMYGHPGIWVKYIWFMFGVATAVMILDEKTRN